MERDVTNLAQENEQLVRNNRKLVMDLTEQEAKQENKVKELEAERLKQRAITDDLEDIQRKKIKEMVDAH